MKSNENLINLELTEGEEILYNTSAKMNTPGKILFFLFLGLGFILGFMLAQFLPDFLIQIYVIFLCAIIWGAIGIYIMDRFKKEKQAFYYITTKRVIITYGHGFLPFRVKHKIINYSDIAHFHDFSDSIDLITIGPEGELHYDGTEAEYLDQTPSIAKKIQLYLEGKEGKKDKIEIIKHLMTYIPAKKHPKLKYAYLNAK